ncbi:uncharacterized protein LOC119661853 [Teleopsis dalmanni]|uniref:uncharacterized protein LOC119661853 n=1 Tax=Teleopsis dalmanni TaxID=139649 RepID=UPI0018CE3472|nr:uncharacterized protein LOC119661853 [Teleopsis dalmanni]
MDPNIRAKNVFEKDFLNFGDNDAVVPTPKLTRKQKKHRFQFVNRIYALSLLCVILAALQWYYICKNTDFDLYIKQNNYFSPVWIAAMFVFIVAFIGFYNYLVDSFMFFPLLFITAEFSTTVVAQPIRIAVAAGSVYGIFFCLIVVPISYLVSLNAPYYMHIPPLSIISWTIRLYLLITISMVVIVACEYTVIEYTYALFATTFIALYCCTFGKTIGSYQFYEAEHRRWILYTLMSYITFLTLLGSSMFLFVKVKSLKLIHN